MTIASVVETTRGSYTVQLAYDSEPERKPCVRRIEAHSIQHAIASVAREFYAQYRTHVFCDGRRVSV